MSPWCRGRLGGADGHECVYDPCKPWHRWIPAYASCLMSRGGADPRMNHLLLRVQTPFRKISIDNLQHC